MSDNYILTQFGNHIRRYFPGIGSLFFPEHILSTASDTASLQKSGNRI